MAASRTTRKSAEVTPFRRLKLAQSTTQPVCVETVTTLRKLLALAQSGRCIGMCFSMCFEDDSYHVGVTGAFTEAPTWARGTVAALDDQLRRAQVDFALRAPKVTL